MHNLVLSCSVLMIPCKALCQIVTIREMATVSGGLETMEQRVLCIQCSPGSLDSEFVNQ